VTPLRGIAAATLLPLLPLLMLGCDQHEGVPVVASPTAGAMPPLGNVRTATLPTPVETMLANGLRVVVLSRPGSSLVVAEFAVLSGGEVDPPGRAGLADFAASLLTRGTAGPGRQRSAVELTTAAEALGGSLRARAGWDASRIGITVTTPKLAAALDLLADTVRYPAFAPVEIERLRAQALDALRLTARDPGELAPRVAARLIHGDGPYGHPRDGTERSIARITAADLRALHRRHYRPDNAALVLAGDLDADTGAALAAQIFGDWTVPPGGLRGRSEIAPAPRSPVPEKTTEFPSAATPGTSGTSGTPPASSAVLVIDLPDAAQAAVLAAVPLPARADPDHYRGLVASAVLGGGYSSRLNREIRIKRGLSYGASADYAIERGAGALYASAQTRNESAAEVASLMRAEFARLRESPVPADELAARKASHAGGYGRAIETASGIASLLVSQISKGIAVGEMGRVISAVDSVEADQVQAWAQTRLGGQDQRFVIVGDARQFSTALATAGFKVERIAIDALDLDTGNLRQPGDGR